MTDEGKPRCPSCGATAAVGAEWCPLCFRPLGPPPASHRSAPGPARPDPRAAIRTAGTSAPAPVQPRAGVFEVDWSPPTNGHGAETADGTLAAIPQAPPPPVPVESSPEPQAAPEATGPRPEWTCPVCGDVNDLELYLCATCGTPFTKLFEERAERPDIDPRSAAKWSLVFPGLGHAKIGRTAEGVSRGILFLWPLGTGVLMFLAHLPGISFVHGVAVVFLLAAVLAYVLAAVDVFRQASGGDPILSAKLLLYATAALVIMSVSSLFLVVLRTAHPH